MSVALQRRSGNRIQQRSGFMQGMMMVGYELQGRERGRLSGDGGADDDGRSESCSSSSSFSSLGRNSDASCDDGVGSGEGEVQSSYKGPLDTMDELEDVLPAKQGISQFYRGKSKSFTSLADAESSSVEDLAKPENPYNRKRKNLLARGKSLDKNFGNALKNSGLAKRLANSGSNSIGNIGSSSFRPPRHRLSRIPSSSALGISSSAPLQKNPCRSASLTDLQHLSAQVPSGSSQHCQ